MLLTSMADGPKDGLIERATTRIKDQIEEVEVMTGDMDPKTNFGLIIIQTEVERWKFLLRSYLRARISKIDKHTLHYLSTQEFAITVEVTWRWHMRRDISSCCTTII